MERFEYQEMMEIGMKIEVEEEFHAVMENLMMKSEDTKTVDLQPAILLEEVEEEFHAVMENLKSEETKTVDSQPAILLEDCQFQKQDDGSEFSAAITQVSEDISLPLLCRLCAIPNNNMTDISVFDATSKNILSKINHCLPATVRDTDTLSKEVCRSCLEELDRCYRFHQTVTKAEKQLLAFARVASENLQEMGKNLETIPQCGRADGWDEHANVDETLNTTSDTEMSNDTLTSSYEKAPAVDTTVKEKDLLSSMRQCSVVLLSIAEMGRKDNSEANSEEKSPRNSKRQNSYSNAGVLDSGTTPASEIIPQNTCDSGVTKKTRSRSVADATQGKEAEHVSRKRVDLAIHDRSHTQERSYRCTTCAKMYKSKYSLSQHNKLHTGKGLYICKYCGKKFPNETDMIRHCRIHTGERPFQCSICEKGFRHSHHLKVHITRAHSYSKGYPCSVCDKSFKILHDKTQHMLVHRDKNQTTLYQCDYCKKSHTRKRHLVRHIKSCKRR